MLLLLGAVIVVLATALANLVSLALVRANGRRAELSMRMALGASRRHLARQLSVEALLLAVIGKRPRVAAGGPGDRRGEVVGAGLRCRALGKSASTARSRCSWLRSPWW